MFVEKFTFQHIGNSIAEGLETNLVIEDITPTLPTPATAYASIHKLTAPDGDVIYENDDFDTPDFDFDPDRSFSIGPLPESADGYALYGTYSLESSVRITVPLVGQYLDDSATSPEAPWVQVTNQGPNAYVVDTNVQLQVINSTNGNDGFYDILSFSEVTPGYTRIYIDAPSWNYSEEGQVSFSIFEYQTVLKEIEYGSVVPELELQVTANCDYATLLMVDNSNLGATVDDTRLITQKYPENLKVEIADKTYATAIAKDTELYANGTYNIMLSRAFSRLTGTNTYESFDLLEGKQVKVDCSDSLCCIVTCYKELQASIENYTCNGNTSKANTLTLKLARINAAIVTANLIRSCGLDGYSTAVQLVKHLIGDDCDCGCVEETADGLAYKVTPITDIVGGGSGNILITSENGDLTVVPEIIGETQVWDLAVSDALKALLQSTPGSIIYSGSAAPNPSFGENTDIVIVTTTGDIYQKDDDQWDLIANFTGPTGPTGEQGVAGPIGPIGPTGPTGPVGGVFINLDPPEVPFISIDLTTGDSFYLEIGHEGFQMSTTGMIEGKTYSFTFRNILEENITILWADSSFMDAPYTVIPKYPNQTLQNKLRSYSFIAVKANNAGDIRLVPKGQDLHKSVWGQAITATSGTTIQVDKYDCLDVTMSEDLTINLSRVSPYKTITIIAYNSDGSSHDILWGTPGSFIPTVYKLAVASPSIAIPAGARVVIKLRVTSDPSIVVIESITD